MSIERSHGKARSTLPRSSDLAPVDTVPDPSEGRAVAGRFAPGNRIAAGQRWKASVRKMLGRGATSEQAVSIAREAWRMYLALLRGMPSDGPSVRLLVALQARHAVIAAYFTDRASELGLDTAAGASALDQASRHGQRVERLAVTSLDVATKLKGTRRGRDLDPWFVPDGAAPAPLTRNASSGAGRPEAAPADQNASTRQPDAFPPIGTNANALEPTE